MSALANCRRGVQSASSDTNVALWLAEAVSSSAGHEHEHAHAAGAQQQQHADGQVSLYDEHEESCYAVAWSARDPWVFASTSYDGRVAINHVPRNVKYRIIL
jgi:WD40 repeat protein